MTGTGDLASLLDLLGEHGFTPRDDHPFGRPGALTFDLDHTRVTLEDGDTEILTFADPPARLPRWRVRCTNAPLAVVTAVLQAAGAVPADGE